MAKDRRKKITRGLPNSDLGPNPRFLGMNQILHKSPTLNRVCQFVQKLVLPKNYRIWLPKRVLQIPLTFLCTAALLLLAGCFSRSVLMTRGTFDSIYLGDSLTEVEKKCGAPYAIHPKKEGVQEYEYIERIRAGDETVEENHYYVEVKDGVVVGKRLTRKTPPAYDMLYDDDPNDVEQQ